MSTSSTVSAFRLAAVAVALLAVAGCGAAMQFQMRGSPLPSAGARATPSASPPSMSMPMPSASPSAASTQGRGSPAASFDAGSAAVAALAGAAGAAVTGPAAAIPGVAAAAGVTQAVTDALSRAHLDPPGGASGDPPAAGDPPAYGDPPADGEDPFAAGDASPSSAAGGDLSLADLTDGYAQARRTSEGVGRDLRRATLTPRVKPPGGPPPPLATKITDVARETQRFGPVGRWSVYLVGAHTLADDPKVQFLAFHYCQFSSSEFMQCAIYDSNRPDANLTGVEYVVSERIFKSFGHKERQWWHPHNFEILSGMELAPGLPPQAQRALMLLVLNSYGKTWQTWVTTGDFRGQATNLPIGKPQLGWSLNHDGEALNSLVAERNSLGPSMRAEASARRGLAPLAHPQAGAGKLSKEFSEDLATPQASLPVGFGPE